MADIFKFHADCVHPALKGKFRFDGETLTEALRKTFENRGHTFTAEQFGLVMTFSSNDEMKKKWKAFVRKIDSETDDFSMVLKTIKTFLSKPFIAAMEYKELAKQWSTQNGEWM